LIKLGSLIDLEAIVEERAREAQGLENDKWIRRLPWAAAAELPMRTRTASSASSVART
jgi:hypothetical protein